MFVMIFPEAFVYVYFNRTSYQNRYGGEMCVEMKPIWLIELFVRKFDMPTQRQYSIAKPH